MSTYAVVYSNGTRGRVATSTMLAEGGEGQIYTVVGKNDVVAKIYFPNHRTQERYEKLRVMVSTPPDDRMKKKYGHTSIAWPIGILMAGRKFVGYLMPRIQKSPTIYNIVQPILREKMYPIFTWRDLHHVGANLAVAMHALHIRGYVIGDVNPKNILVTKRALVTLVDTDSFQVEDPTRGKVYRCPVGMPEYTPPELQQGAPFHSIDRNKYHDYFGLAVLVFQLLMEGRHPFMGTPRNQHLSTSMALIYCIKNGIFPYYLNAQFGPPKAAPKFTWLKPEIQQLFIRAFVEGSRIPGRRPSTLEWYNALTQAEQQLVQCSREKGHWYSGHLSKCPWCERDRQLNLASHQQRQNSTTTPPIQKPLRKGGWRLRVPVPGWWPRRQRLPVARPHSPSPSKTSFWGTVKSVIKVNIVAPIGIVLFGGGTSLMLAGGILSGLHVPTSFMQKPTDEIIVYILFWAYLWSIGATTYIRTQRPFGASISQTIPILLLLLLLPNNNPVRLPDIFPLVVIVVVIGLGFRLAKKWMPSWWGVLIGTIAAAIAFCVYITTIVIIGGIIKGVPIQEWLLGYLHIVINNFSSFPLFVLTLLSGAIAAVPVSLLIDKFSK